MFIVTIKLKKATDGTYDLSVTSNLNGVQENNYYVGGSLNKRSMQIKFNEKCREYESVFNNTGVEINFISEVD